MRDIYTSPRADNIDRVVTLFARHGIATRITRRTAYEHASYARFSYGRDEDRSRWARVEVKSAADLPHARALLRELGIAPWTEHGDALETARTRRFPPRRSTIVRRVHGLALAALAAALIMLVLRLAGIA